MKKSLINFSSNLFLTLVILLANPVFPDNFLYNTYNNHGVVGIINLPTARLYNEGVHGITLYDGTPDQKITLSSNPYDWLEASFFILIFKEGHIVRLNGILYASKIIKTKDSILS